MLRSLVLLLTSLLAIATLAAAPAYAHEDPDSRVVVDDRPHITCVGAWYEVYHVHVGPVEIHHVHCTGGQGQILA
jgi:hypothetical protein